ncbi:hypothetical protein [Vibrio owensii]|uniref:Uncharacterized protein n=1 Tax=Vibrio owensii CAIM 1854 = LMG 25443 TaxID=1229493 RepID=A0A0C1VVV2_9VIBR|nr:hypothetical protein [Vibrio owensii]KIF54088.1 hypothetical protein H735_06780 [Vibrio owensii CAIM 1854 = LMG 25443]
MSTTKSKLLSLLAEFNMEGGPIMPDGVYVLNEYADIGDDWKLEFTDHHNADGAATIYVNRSNDSLALSYDAECHGQYENGEIAFYREYLVFGETAVFDNLVEEYGVDVEEHSLWWETECDVPYVEFLCPHLVKDMVFEDCQATSKDDGEEVKINVHYDGVTVTDGAGKKHLVSMSECQELYSDLSVSELIDTLEKRFS